MCNEIFTKNAILLPLFYFILIIITLLNNGYDENEVFALIIKPPPNTFKRNLCVFIAGSINFFLKLYKHIFTV